MPCTCPALSCNPPSRSARCTPSAAARWPAGSRAAGPARVGAGAGGGRRASQAHGVGPSCCASGKASCPITHLPNLAAQTTQAQPADSSPAVFLPVFFLPPPTLSCSTYSPLCATAAALSRMSCCRASSDARCGGRAGGGAMGLRLVGSTWGLRAARPPAPLPPRHALPAPPPAAYSTHPPPTSSFISRSSRSRRLSSLSASARRCAIWSRRPCGWGGTQAGGSRRSASWPGGQPREHHHWKGVSLVHAWYGAYGPPTFRCC